MAAVALVGAVTAFRMPDALATWFRISSSLRALQADEPELFALAVLKGKPGGPFAAIASAAYCCEPPDNTEVAARSCEIDDRRERRERWDVMDRCVVTHNKYTTKLQYSLASTTGNTEVHAPNPV